MLADQGAHTLLDRLLVGHVEDDRVGLALLLFDEAHRGLEVFRDAAGAQHRGACFRQAESHVAAQPARGAGDQGDAVLQRKEV